jgi:hypothetical protein
MDKKRRTVQVIIGNKKKSCKVLLLHSIYSPAGHPEGRWQRKRQISRSGRGRKCGNASNIKMLAAQNIHNSERENIKG